ncbi:hypothetical protein [Nostoc sp. 'Peltigera membranacea cyanobiont' 232]|uniref:hypothetical protein n=1 Tax=Nostoc sp. 'Peltigera membranacea cyanobiont' 232 TaxID=2014531 RepID=UPI000B9511F6|nr:hypothetical protein [Nostoc sp. 'Peltigera membranacea cyanobiont' 232]OYE00033.1 hypothetical protein CDG79_37435 [Nostoc sp. 'Peltigera membranacea cyanobiont' 232]
MGKAELDDTDLSQRNLISHCTNGLVVFEDLLMALGKTNISIVKESDLTLENLRLLDKVWTGENMRVFELIAILEKDGEGNF